MICKIIISSALLTMVHAASLPAVDFSNLFKTLEELPTECIMKGMGLVGKSNHVFECLMTFNKEDDEECEKNIAGFIAEAGKIALDENCKDPMEKIFREYIMDVSLEPILTIGIKFSQCLESTVIEHDVCKQELHDGISKILNDLGKEIFKGLPEEFRADIDQLASSFVKLNECGLHSKYVKDSLKDEDYKKFETAMKPLLYDINSMRTAGPFAGKISDDQALRIDEVLQHGFGFSPFTMTPSDMKDLRNCKSYWTEVKDNMIKVQNVENEKILINKLIAKFPVIQPDEALIDAVIDNLNKFDGSQFNCVFEWTVDNIDKCVNIILGHVESDLKQIEVDEEKEEKVLEKEHNDFVLKKEEEEKARQQQKAKEEIKQEEQKQKQQEKQTGNSLTTTTTTTTYLPNIVSTSTSTDSASPNNHDSGISTGVVVLLVFLCLFVLGGLCFAYFKYRISRRTISIRAFPMDNYDDESDLDDETATLLHDFTDDEDDDEPITM